jgi:general secretion pathway protein L
MRALAAEEALVLAVPPAWVLRRVLRLPAAAEARLDAVLDFELEQHIPFAAEEVLRAARVFRRDPEARRIEVEVAVLPRALVAPAAAALRRAGLGAPLLARPDPGAVWPAVPLDALAPPRRRWRARAEAALALAAALLAGHLALADLRAREAAAAAVEARAAAARAAAERVLALEAEAAALRTRLAAAAELRGGRPPAAGVLEELARRLPDGAWLTELRLAGDALALVGFAAPRSDALLETLQAAPMFRDARFAAPVTRAAREGADRFQIGLRVVVPPPPPPEAPSAPRRTAQTGEGPR